ncbi:MAG: DUF488 family protein [Dehalococcoidia bacterium]
MTTVYTIGHSNTPVQALLDQLTAAGIEIVVDIRRFPSSRRNPQFNATSLAASLRGAGIEYQHAEALGGRREPLPDSPNRAIASDQLRGYVDYSATPEFEAAEQQLLATADQRRTAVMCAEAQPDDCHRFLLADALVACGHDVLHLVHGELKPHQLSPIARVDDGRVTYPALL